jgi:hypothetical protein
MRMICREFPRATPATRDLGRPVANEPLPPKDLIIPGDCLYALFIFLEIALLGLQRVRRFLGECSAAAYLADELCRSAVERQLEIAGDALGQLHKLDASGGPVPGRLRLATRIKHARPLAFA